MRARKFFLPCISALAAVATAASLFTACAEGAGFDDDTSDAGDAGPVTDATPGTSSGAATSSSGAAASSSSGGSSGGSSSGSPTVDCKVVINEVSMGSSDWVELYNPTGCDDVDLSTYELVYRSATGTSDTPLFAGDDTTLGGGEFFVIGAGGDAPFTGGPSPLGAAGGQLALKDGGSVDEVAYGSANGSIGEGDPAPTTSTDSIQRIPDGTDTDDNAADFQVSSPTKGSPNE